MSRSPRSAGPSSPAPSPGETWRAWLVGLLKGNWGKMIYWFLGVIPLRRPGVDLHAWLLSTQASGFYGDQQTKSQDEQMQKCRIPTEPPRAQVHWVMKSLTQGPSAQVYLGQSTYCAENPSSSAAVWTIWEMSQDHTRAGGPRLRAQGSAGKRSRKDWDLSIPIPQAAREPSTLL